MQRVGQLSWLLHDAGRPPIDPRTESEEVPVASTIKVSGAVEFIDVLSEDPTAPFVTAQTIPELYQGERVRVHVIASGGELIALGSGIVEVHFPLKPFIGRMATIREHKVKL